MGLQINENSIKRIESKTDAELAKTFLTSKHLPIVSFQLIADEAMRIADIRTKEGTAKYPYYSALKDADKTFFMGRVVDLYYSIVHNPKKYDLKLEPVIALYNDVLADNWETYKNEEIEAERKAKAKGLAERNFTSVYNYDLIAKVLGVVTNIDLNKTNNVSL